MQFSNQNYNVNPMIKELSKAKIFDRSKGSFNKSKFNKPSRIVINHKKNYSLVQQKSKTLVFPKLPKHSQFNLSSKVKQLLKEKGTFKFTEKNYPGKNNRVLSKIKRFGDGCSYLGQVDSKGKRQGKGRQQRSNGDYFDGPANLYCISGEFFSGYWKNGRYNHRVDVMKETKNPMFKAGKKNRIKNKNGKKSCIDKAQ